MEINVKDLAMFTLVQKLKDIVNHKFHKLDEDFDLEEFLTNDDYVISPDDFKKIEDKLFQDWRNISDDDLKEIQNKIISKINELLPEPLSKN